MNVIADRPPGATSDPLPDSHILRALERAKLRVTMAHREAVEKWRHPRAGEAGERTVRITWRLARALREIEDCIRVFEGKES